MITEFIKELEELCNKYKVSIVGSEDNSLKLFSIISDISVCYFVNSEKETLETWYKTNEN